MFWRESALPIGVDVGSHALRVLQLRLKGDRLEVQAAARADIPAGEDMDPAAHAAAVAAALKKLLASARFTGRACVSAISPARISAKSLRLPQMPEPEIDQAVRWEAGDRLGFDLTDGQLAYFRSGEVRRGTETRDEYLLFGATAATLRAHLALLAAAGLRARAIDLQPCAILRALAHQALLAPDAPAAVADLGHAGTQIMILQEGRLVFYKHVEIGEQALDAAVGQKLGVPPAEAAQLRAGLVVAANNPDDHDANTPLGQAVFDAMRPTLEELARELDMCLRYYGVTFRGNRPDVMHLVGGRHYCPRSLDAIAAVLGLRMEKAQPLRSVAALTDLTRPDKSGEWAAAMGLSLYPRNAQEVAA